MRHLTGVVVACFAVLAAACGRSDGSPQGSALSSIFKVGKQSTSISVIKGENVIYTPEVWDVLQDIELVAVEPAHWPKGIDVLDVRFTLLRGADGVAHPGAGPGGGCIPDWPPAGFGRTSPAKAARLHSGERVSISLYLRPTVTGEVALEGLHVTYKLASGKAATQTFEHSHDTHWLVVEDKAHLPPETEWIHCFPPPPEWLTPPKEENP